MGLRAYNDALSIINADLPNILMNLIDTDPLDPKAIRRKLINEGLKLGMWVWDTFNFDKMNVEGAVRNETLQRVVLNPQSDGDIAIPGIGYTLISQSEDQAIWSVIVKDIIEDSSAASGIENKFNVKPLSMDEKDGIYTWKYSITVNRKDENGGD
jgi:hypothetical protein